MNDKMQFQFSSLKYIQPTELIAVFNRSFADYFVKIVLNENSLSDKILAENIDLQKSVGAFFNDKLVGFILMGIENGTAYNGGTGVLPEFRGNSLTQKMYDFIFPMLKAENVYSHQLEVISENYPAIKTYEKIGFQKARKLACFNGKIKTAKTNPDIEIKALNEINLKLFPKFWNYQPSWQNSLSAIQRTKKLYKIAATYLKNDLAGYVIYSETGRIKQFAVKKDFRRLAIGQSLFEFVKKDINTSEIVITNVDKNDLASISFLKKIGLNLFLEQFEMTLENRV